MTTIQEIARWIATLHPENNIATDDGGNCLVELDADGKETGVYYEVGGIPEAEENDEGECVIRYTQEEPTPGEYCGYCGETIMGNPDKIWSQDGKICCCSADCFMAATKAP